MNRQRKPQTAENTDRFLRLGRQCGPLFGFQAELREIAQAFGFRNKQQADYACCVALGKFIYRMRQALKEPKP